MTFAEAVKSGFRNYVNFSSRAARSEYWYWILFSILMSFGSKLIDLAMFSHKGISPINTLVALALLLPSLAVSVRRLHDLDFSGWWFLLVFTGIGAFVLLGWFCLRGRRDRSTDRGPNRFGPDPLAATAAP
jgi:uncharacterized membrane protein YhaH (DUF805 family)